MISTARVLPAFICRLPFTVRVPALLPGDSVPPLCTVRVLVELLAKRLPSPPRVAPAATVTPEVADSAPFTSRVPALTLVAPA